MNKEFIKLTYETFLLLKKGDKVYKDVIQYGNKFIRVECEIISAKWLYSGTHIISNETLKAFFYYEISYLNGNFRNYADSFSKNYERLYIDKDLENELKTRKK